MRDGRQAFFLFLPEGEDPDTLVRKEGRSGFEARIKQAMPLSEYFYSELSRDVNVATLDGRARLAEHAKPLLAKLPDGAFRDLMYAELEKRTGVRESASKPIVSRQNASSITSSPPAPMPLVRQAIMLLLAEPSLAMQAEPPYPFAKAENPGVPLLIELLELARARPGINTAVLLEHFAERSERTALQKLAAKELQGDPENFGREFNDALQRLTSQAIQQRREALQRKQREVPLSDSEKVELRELLAQKAHTDSA
jgi:DNA primase